ncbi:hypothetical protein EG329_006075 [Mollisiaceae sp. DMI_Dod_QoI]|nr:hypothetical protein EG329_006075 [Helotiales sp. DMI_Dod_QoI]
MSSFLRQGRKHGHGSDQKRAAARTPLQTPAYAAELVPKPAPAVPREPPPPVRCAMPKPFHGLKIFYDPREEDLVDLDLVFVHGLNGDHLGTWKHDESGVVWPRDLVPESMPHTRVLSFSYRADVYDNSSIAGIRDHARNLLNHLRDKRPRNLSSRSIVFVAHSLGGLVVKQALRLAKNEESFESISEATQGILLFSTPHHGSDEAKWLQIAEAFAPLAPSTTATTTNGRTVADASPLVEALKRDSRDVLDISEDFRFLAERYALVSFYEMDAWPNTRAPIVSKGSALLHLTHEDQVPLPANHADMVRFEGLDDPMFEQVENRIKVAAKGREIEREVESRGKNADSTTTMRFEITRTGGSYGSRKGSEKTC